MVKEKTYSEISRNQYYEILAREKEAMKKLPDKPELRWKCLEKSSEKGLTDGGGSHK